LEEMTETTTNILSIGINRQRIGIAVFSNGELEYVTGRALPADTSRVDRTRLMRDITDLINHHGIGVITMQRLTVQQLHARAVARVCKGVQSSALRSGLTVFIGSISYRNRSVTRTPEELASLYPELRRYLGDAAWERRYYKHIFKAVSAGVEWLRIKKIQGDAND